MRFSRRSGAALASVGMGKVELLARGSWHQPAPRNLTRRVVAVGSTGDRVGKTTVTAHLAVAMANLGAQVIAVDMDLESPCLHALLGMERPALGLQALLDNEISNLDSCLSLTTVRNLRLLTGGAPGPGASVPGAARIDGDRKQILRHQIEALDADVIILDLGGGAHNDLCASFAFGAISLLVAAPRPSSLVSSFELLRQIARRAGGSIERPNTDAPPAFCGRLVGNLVTDSAGVETFHAFSRLVHAQLAIELPVAGCVRVDGRLSEGGPLGRSPTVGGRLTEIGRAFQLMAEGLLRDDLPAPASPAARDPVGPPMTEALLTNSLDLHRRRHLRHEVDWTATMRMGDRSVAVRVVDISMGGAALDVVSQLQIGESGTLLFDQLPGCPALPVVVKTFDGPIRRAGLAFTGATEPRQQVMAAAKAQCATRP